MCITHWLYQVVQSLCYKGAAVLNSCSIKLRVFALYMFPRGSAIILFQWVRILLLPRQLLRTANGFDSLQNGGANCVIPNSAIPNCHIETVRTSDEWLRMDIEGRPLGLSSAVTYGG